MSQLEDAGRQLALLRCAQMSAADNWTIEAGYASGIELMENAGAAVAHAALVRYPEAAHVVVLCGPGNNGGDGYVIARILADTGLTVDVVGFGDPGHGSDAAIAASRYDGRLVSCLGLQFRPGMLVIDAIFGAGLTRTLPDDVAQTLKAAKGAGCRIIAVDLPSGVNGDSGHDLGGAIAADATVTFFRKKPGHLLYPGRTLCGEVIVADIGIRSGVFDEAPPDCFEIRQALWANKLPAHRADIYKYARGHAAVFSGGALSTGASRLAAMAAQRSGAGAVTILGRRKALKIHAAHVTSIMLRDHDTGDELKALDSLNTCRACVLGPGFGDFDAARRTALGVLAAFQETALVLDADGITAFADDPEALFRAAMGARERLVLTPHEGEFARLFPDLAADRSLSKLQKAVLAAARAHCIVVYKGPDTVIAAPDGRAAINANGTVALATAGSGDVLAGIVAGLLAQGMQSWDAACAAVWLHGEAGRAGGRSPIAEDIIDELPGVVENLQSP